MLNLFEELFEKLHFNNYKSKKILSVFEEIEELYDTSFDNDIIRLEIGDDFIEFFDDILQIISATRTELAKNYSFIYPVVRVRNNSNLQENEIKIYLQEKEIFHEFLIPNKKSIIDYVKDTLQKIFDEKLEFIFTNEVFEKIIEKSYNKNYYLTCRVHYFYTNFEIKQILLNILKNKKTIKNLTYIFEKIEEHGINKNDSGIEKSINKLSTLILNDL